MTAPPVALLLPGQGSQHHGMAVPLYGYEPVFSEHMDAFFTDLGTVGSRLRSAWLSDDPATPIDDAALAQPLLFAIGHALGRTLLAHGVRLAALLGHSIGELAAAALAGVFDRHAAASIMRGRLAAMADAAPGEMYAAGASAEQVEPYLGETAGVVAIGAINAPTVTVLSGPRPQLAAVADRLASEGIRGLSVPADRPFHSPKMAAVVPRFEQAFDRVPLRAPAVTIYSTRTAAPIGPDEAKTPGFWAGQLATPVLYWPALCALLRSGDYTLVEAGPGGMLSVLARRHPAVRRGTSAVVPLLPPTADATRETWRAALARLTGG
ncbi:acyltransferase domain-containing protein [Amycolatopsis silviterrae]|uniref:Acyltransferase domain-containing protein n=1 Tax=Amycolatopsis silviterrae TaxID=1656914 RepID=A0ABW5H6G1_9PSEU